MIARNFYKDKYERLKFRKRYNIKQQILNSREKKYVIYIFRSNKHLYLQLIFGGCTVVSENTISYKRIDNKRRNDVLHIMVDEFCSKVKLILKDVKVSQFLYDISYYRYQGCIKNVIDYFRKIISNTQIDCV